MPAQELGWGGCDARKMRFGHTYIVYVYKALRDTESCVELQTNRSGGLWNIPIHP
jgi:hypothetical protein